VRKGLATRSAHVKINVPGIFGKKSRLSPSSRLPVLPTDLSLPLPFTQDAGHARLISVGLTLFFLAGCTAGGVLLGGLPRLVLL